MGPKLQAPMRSRLARPTGAAWKADKSSLRHEVSLIQGQENQAAHTNSQSHSTVQRRTEGQKNDRLRLFWAWMGG